VYGIPGTFPLTDIHRRGITITPGLDPSVRLPIFTLPPLNNCVNMFALASSLAWCDGIGGLASTEFVVVAVRISSADIIPINIPAVDIPYIIVHDSSLINKYLY